MFEYHNIVCTLLLSLNLPTHLLLSMTPGSCHCSCYPEFPSRLEHCSHSDWSGCICGGRWNSSWSGDMAGCQGCQVYWWVALHHLYSHLVLSPATPPTRGRRVWLYLHIFSNVTIVGVWGTRLALADLVSGPQTLCPFLFRI